MPVSSGVAKLLNTFVCLLPVLALGCSSDGGSVWVDLRTDFVPATEFDEARVFLAEAGGIGSEQVLTHYAQPADYVSGQRVVVFEGLRPGDYRIRVQLHSGNVIVGARSVTFSLGQSTNATLVVTRSCTGVVCPTEEDLSATECSGGRCVSPGCSAEMPEQCGDGCTEDSDCVAPSPCADGICTAEGSCVFTSCRGGLDAGMGDVGTQGYRWRAGEFGACSASCGAGEESRMVSCVDSRGNSVEPALCIGTPPETSRPCDAGSMTCGFGEWSAFGECDGTCSQMQTRPCNAPGHCVGVTEQVRECSGGSCCPSAGATCGPTTFRRTGGWVCRDDGGDFNVLFYSNYIFTERLCNSSRTCVPQDLERSLECICGSSGPGCTSSASGCGVVGFGRCRDAVTGARGPCPNTAAHGECF